MALPALRVSGISVNYGGVQATKDVSLQIKRGQCVAVVGANGAGKSSLLRGISGFERIGPVGEVWLNDARIDQLSPEARARRGLGHVLENRHIFPNLTVRGNLELAERGLAGRQVNALARVLELLPELGAILPRRAGLLSGGQQQLVVVARALIGSPIVLLLDEPTTGLAPQLIDRTAELVQAVTSQGTAILIVEQQLQVVRRVASEVHILSHGRVVEVLAADSPQLESVAHSAYLGSDFRPRPAPARREDGDE